MITGQRMCGLKVANANYSSQFCMYTEEFQANFNLPIAWPAAQRLYSYAIGISPFLYT